MGRRGGSLSSRPFTVGGIDDSPWPSAILSHAVGEREVTRYNAVSYDKRYRTHTTLSRIQGEYHTGLITSPHKHNTLWDPLDTTLDFSKLLSLDTCCRGQAGLQSSGLLLGRLLVCWTAGARRTQGSLKGLNAFWRRLTVSACQATMPSWTRG